LGAAGARALAFIEQMEKVRLFFGGYLMAHSTLPNPTFGYEVTFRVNKEMERAGNGILNWTLSTRDTTVTMRSPSHVGFWQAGDPVTVVFGWALNSPLQPTLMGEHPN